MVKALAPRGRAVVVSVLIIAVCVLAFAVHAEGAPAAQGTLKPAWRVSETFRADVPESITAPGTHDAWLAGVYPDNAHDVFVDHWNGIAWRAVARPYGAFTESGLTIAASSASNAWVFTWTNPAVAEPYAVAWHWNGRHWSHSAFPRETYIYSAAAFSRTDAWAFGAITGDNGKTAPYVVRFDGSRWLRVPAPFVPTDASAVSAHDIWAAGLASWSGTSFEAAQWADGKWHIRHLPDLRLPRGDAAELPLILAVSSHDVWIASTISRSNGRPAQEVLLHYDGRTWARVRVPYSSITEFRAMTPDGRGGLWIAADTSKLPGGVLYGYRDGHWTRQQAPVRRGDYTGLDAMATRPGSTTAWAVGYTGHSKGNPDTLGVLYAYGP